MNEISLSFAILFGCGLFFQWLAWYLKLPSVIFLLGAGILLGPIMGVINPEHIFGNIYEPFIEFSVVIIVFEGALGLKLKELPSIYKGLIPLLVIGPLLSFVLTAIFCYKFLSVSLPFSLLFGAILVVTGPTVVLPLLRSANIQSRVAKIIKWEGLINDPLAVLMAAFVFQMILVWEESSKIELLMMSLFKSIIAAMVVGVVPIMAFIAVNKRKLMPKYLNNAVIFVVVITSSALAEMIQHGAGVLVATVQGIILGNSSLGLIEDLKNFKESVTLLLLSVIFISLAAELKGSQISLEIFLKGTGLFLGLLVIRAITVFITTSGSGCSWKEKLLITWCAPRGIVAASMAGLFAHKLQSEGLQGGEIFVSLIFFIIIVTVLVYGSSFKSIAKKLELTEDEAHGLLLIGASPWSVSLAEQLKGIDVPVAICDSIWHGLKKARLNGIQTYYGDLLIMLDSGNIQLSQYHAVLAATSNSAYNSLVCTRLSSEFGWESVYQLPPDVDDEGNPLKELPLGMSGKILSDLRATFFNLYDLTYSGWKFRKTSITEEFNLKSLKEQTPGAFHLLHVTKDKKVQFIDSLNQQTVAPGGTVISLVPPQTSDTGASVSESQ